MNQKTSFAAFKSNAASLTEKLQNRLREDNSNGRQDDERYWRCDRDKAGNGYAVIRFLPPAPNENKPKGVDDDFYVRLYTHAFQGKGGWYIENSRTSLGKDEVDPVGEYNSSLWNAGVEDLKEQARKQKRKTVFISNILVIEDPAHPENNGKVFLYKYGKKIFEKILDKMEPQFPGEEKVNVFDFWKGANFRLKIREVEKFPNYDKSEFDAPSALFGGDDAKIEALWYKQHPLSPLLEESNFKPYKELKARLDRVLGLSSNAYTSRVAKQDVGEDENEDVMDEHPTSFSQKLPGGETMHVDVVKNEDPEAEEDELAYFKRMAQKNK